MLMKCNNKLRKYFEYHWKLLQQAVQETEYHKLRRNQTMCDGVIIIEAFKKEMGL